MSDEKDDIPDCLRPLSPEELAKMKPLSREDIEAALEEGRRQAELWRQSQHPPVIRSGIFYR